MPTLQELEAEKARRAQGGSGGPSLADLEAEKARRSPTTTNDVLRSIPSALRSGTEMLLGMPGDVNELTQRAASRVSRALFGDQITDQIREQVPTGLRSEGITTPQIMEAGDEVFGPHYESKTTPGRYVHSIVEQVPGAVFGPGRWLTKGLMAFLGGMGGEAAGEMAEGTGYEELARAGGSFVGSIAGGRAMRPGQTTREAAREANVATLDREGVPMTAGQRTGSPRIQYIESELGGAAFDRAIDRQRSVFTDATLRRIGEAGGPALPEDLRRARLRIGGEFERLAAGSSVPFDQQLQTALTDAGALYEQVQPLQAPAVWNMFNNLIEKASLNGGMLRGDQYQAAVTQLRELAGASDATTQGALDAFISALDDAVERSLTGAPLFEWRNARRQYANLLTVERAMTGGGVEPATGMVSPVRLRSAISGGGNGPATIAEGRSNLTDLANAGVSVTKDLPQSGTAPRTAARVLPATVAGVGTGYLTGDLSASLGAAGAAYALPELVGETVMSRPVQSLLRGLQEDERAMLSALLAARLGAGGGQP